MNLTLVAPLEGLERNNWPFTFREASNYEAIIADLQRFRSRIYKREIPVSDSYKENIAKFLNRSDDQVS